MQVDFSKTSDFSLRMVCIEFRHDGSTAFVFADGQSDAKSWVLDAGGKAIKDENGNPRLDAGKISDALKAMQSIEDIIKPAIEAKLQEEGATLGKSESVGVSPAVLSIG